MVLGRHHVGMMIIQVLDRETDILHVAACLQIDLSRRPALLLPVSVIPSTQP